MESVRVSAAAGTLFRWQCAHKVAFNGLDEPHRQPAGNSHRGAFLSTTYYKMRAQVPLPTWEAFSPHPDPPSLPARLAKVAPCTFPPALSTQRTNSSVLVDVAAAVSKPAFVTTERDARGACSASVAVEDDGPVESGTAQRRVVRSQWCLMAKGCLQHKTRQKNAESRHTAYAVERYEPA